MNGSSAGSERLLHDGLGSVVGRVAGIEPAVLYRYDAWGGFRTTTAPGSGEASLAYAGQHRDADLGRSYAQQRWYESGTGRFLSEDPAFGDPRTPMSLHAWGYANANPLAFIDPTGERAAWEQEEKELSLWAESAKRHRASYDRRSAAGKLWSRIRRHSDYSYSETLEANIHAPRAAIEAAAEDEPVLATPFNAEGLIFSTETEVRLANGARQRLFDVPVYIGYAGASARSRPGACAADVVSGGRRHLRHHAGHRSRGRCCSG